MTLAQLQRIRKIARGRGEDDLRLLEGPKAVRDALATGHVAELWIDEALDPDLGRVARADGVPVGFGTRKDFERLGQTTTPQGALALVRNVARSLEDVAGRDGLLLWLDGVQDPGNVGALFRVAAAFAVGGLLLGPGTADPQGLKAFRASAGLALRLPFARGETAAIQAAIGDAPVWTLDAAGDDLFTVDRVPPRLVLAVGAEGKGVGVDVRRASVRKIGIPLAAGVESLNVAVATGIAVSHLARVRA